MKNSTLSIRLWLLLLPALLFLNSVKAQPSKGGTPKSFYVTKTQAIQSISAEEVTVPDVVSLGLLDEADEKTGALRKIGRGVTVNYTPQSSGTWDNLADGSKIWRLKLHLPNALAVGVYYDQFYLPFGSELYLYNETKSQILGKYDSDNNPVSGPFSTELVEGQTVTIEYYQPSWVTISPILVINELAYIYRDYVPRFDRVETRDFGDSESCEVNVNCSEGTAWANIKRSAVRILVKVGASYGWCSGALVNNTAVNCIPYILTADHCAGNGGSSAADLNQWIFYFNYQAPGCANPGSEGTLASQSITGCMLRARGGQSGTIGSTSDFYLVQMNTNVPVAWNPYYAGWNRANVGSPSGVSIHHPAGDIKKISTYTTTLVSDLWPGGSIAGTHWRVVWAATANGHGVTEGGSSGSPIFDNNGRIVGQLSGGSSFCTSPTAPDLYGKFYYDWNLNTFPATNNQLRPWLDPGNIAGMTLNGTNSPCGPSAPVADFIANNTTPCIGSTVTFTDLSSNTPTSWAWAFSPTSITYVGGTSATSQHPQVQFGAVGPYTVTLTATNGLGSDPEVKTAYIAPTTAGTLPFLENFEAVTFPPTGWTRVSADGAGVAWNTDGIHQFERRAAAGNAGSTAGSAAVNNFNYNTDTTQVDNLISRAISLAGSTAPRMTFKRAYKSYGTVPWLDELRVYISSDCGATWGSAVYYKKGNTLATSGILTTTFTPSIAADWDIDTVDLTAYVGQNIKVKFEVSNKYGNNIYLDDINIINTTGSCVTTASNTGPVCAGGTFNLATTSAGGGYTYSWAGPSGYSSAVQNPTGVTASAVAGTYNYTVTATNGVTTCTSVTAVTVNAVPATPTASSSSPDCTGQTISLTTPTVAGATYAWTGPSGYSSATQNPTRPSATTAMAGTYSVTVTVGGCTSAAGTTTVVVNTTPTIMITGGSAICAGASATLTVTGGTTYSWNTGSTSNPLVVTPAATTTYTVTGTTAGCTGTAVSTVTVNPNPVVNVNSPTICSGATATLTAGGATTYAWSTGASTNPINVSPGSTTSYTVTGTTSGCQGTAVSTVTVNPTPPTPTIMVAGLTLTSSSATGNQWYLNGVLIPGATSQNYTVTANGNYTVVVTIAGCSSAPSAVTIVTSVGIDSSVNPYFLNVFPNPNDGNFMVQFNTSLISNYTIEITNALGQLVYTEVLKDYTGTYSKQLSVVEFGKGVYMISLTNSQHETVKRIIVY